MIRVEDAVIGRIGHVPDITLGHVSGFNDPRPYEQIGQLLTGRIWPRFPWNA
jgi:hypothetical protein